MSLRYFALGYPVKSKFVKKALVFLLLLFFCPVFSQNSLDDIENQASKLFSKEDYSSAYKLYSQLVSNFPKDPEFNYRLGVCMIYSEPDKKKCLPYLRFAAGNQEEELPDVLFYLGKACHINYLFDEAIKHYNEFKSTASSSQLKKFQVDREIKAATNGKRLLSNLTDLEVIAKTELPESDYFRNYKKIGGKLLVKPDDFKTGTDKKRKEKSVVFLPNRSEVVYFSSYGDNADNGKDIYTAYKLPSGNYSKPEKVKGINTEFDEDYPFLHPDGKTLYFASKGHNSMGGYDIFKSTFNEGSNTWEPPVNLEFPINSPDDDYLFVTDSLETIAYFSTGRQSPPGKIDVLKVKTKRRPIDVLAIKGSVIPGSPDHSLKSTIKVKDLFSGSSIGTFTSEETGEYTLELPNGAKLLFTVETPGQETQSTQVSLPMASASKPFKQTISYDKGKLKVLNYFDELPNDESYLQYLKVIEKKAKLDVSESDTNVQAVVNESPAKDKTSDPGKDKKPTITAEETSSPGTTASADPKKGLDNMQLAKMARQDAEESRLEAAQLNRDFVAANETGIKQKQEAEKKISEANEAIASAETISNEEEKRTALENANAIKVSAENDLAVAEKILTLAKSLDEDARTKKKEADLNDQYAAELDLATRNKNNNKASLAKLEELQKQINDLSGQKNGSENVVNSIKNDIGEKEKQIAGVEEINSGIKSNIEEIKVAIGEKENELAKTKKRSAKENISSQISELKSDQEDKEKQVSANEAELKTLGEELTALKSELDIATKITSENMDVVSANAVPEPVTHKMLQEKYKDKIPVTDARDRSSLEKSTNQLNNFNKEIEKALANNKTDLAKTKNQVVKKQLTAEIKQLEATKKQNQQLIASNSKQLAELDKSSVQSSETARTYDPLTAVSSEEAVTKLDKLEIQLSGNDNENFDFNAYQHPKAQSLKVEADARINDAIAKQKKLKDDIAISKSEIQKAGPESGAPAATVEQLNKEAEEISGRAQKAREEAKTKQGAEKDKLLEEARNLEDQANDKYIQAAEVTMTDNTAIVSANQENIQNLIKENKSGEADLNVAKSLNEEANLAFRKAADIRAEANSLSSKGAKLGSFSNAEEKEAEAILKQQQAIEILTKSNFLFKLKVPVTSTSTAQKKTEGPDLNARLEAVNTGLSELAAIKIESYQKLYEANDAEIEQLTSTAKSNQSAIDATPSLKSDLISGTGKADNAKTLKQKSDDASNPNEKLNNLTASVKKQNEAIKQLTALNVSISQLATNTGSNPPAATNTSSAEADLANTATSFSETEQPSLNETKTPDPADIRTVDVAGLAQRDTTTAQVLNYFDSNSPALRSSQANSLVKSAISQLKDFEAQSSNLDAELTKLEENTDDTPPDTPDELNKKAEVILTEAEPVNNRSLALKKEAESKEGEEKNYTLAQARELEIQAQDKMIEASNYKQQAHEAEYKTNSNAITELMERLNTDNPDLSAGLQEKRNAYAPLKTQISNLRAEANALNNKAAKLGAISNAEEKETELIQKQTELLNELKKQYPDYIVKPVGGITREERTADLGQKKTLLREKQYAELTNLTNAFSLEYESSKNSIPTDLSPAQQGLKQNAEDLNSESKRLLIRSASEKNDSEKIKLLTLAAKSGNAAVEQLNKLLPEIPAVDSDLKALSEIGNRLISDDNEPGRTDAKITGNRNTRGSVKIDGLEVLSGNAYSNANPIPIDSKMEDGLVFRVQIGAFKTQLPNNAFKGLSPLNGETTTNGYFRYTAGNFNRIENANAVKNDLRNLGYRDAFVVVYFNGKRITLAEAVAMLNNEGKTIDPNAPQTAGITANANVPKATFNTAIQESVVVTKELEQTNGLLYTIQVGVYTKQITKPQLLNLRPIFREQLTNGLYRYTAGIYNNTERLLTDKTRVVDLGVKDAFVSAYLNGKRIPFAEAKDRQVSDASIRMEPETPVIFPEAAAADLSGSPSTATVQPFTNEVREYPAATPDNGVKTNEEGICFKVQIGAFSKQVPNDVAAKFSAIKTWPVENKQINGLFVYNIGNFSEPKFAKALKEEVIALGINDAFITVYKDGQKLYGATAESYLR